MDAISGPKEEVPCMDLVLGAKTDRWLLHSNSVYSGNGKAFEGYKEHKVTVLIKSGCF